MSLTPATHRTRGRLLASASLALAMLATIPIATAQTTPVAATGDAVVVNNQSSKTLARAIGDDAGATISLSGATQSGSVALTGNGIGVAARGNAAALTIAPETLLTVLPRATTLRIDGGGVDGTANLLIANGQNLQGGSAQADQFNAPYRMSLGSIGDSDIALTGNRSDTVARGNAVLSTIAAPTHFAGGAGIVSAQRATAGTLPASDYDGVAARVGGGAIAETAGVASSRIAVSGNAGSADAASNAADNALAAPLSVGMSDDSGPGPVMMMARTAAPQDVGPRFSILNRQTAGNVVKARSGYLADLIFDGRPAIRATIGGDARSSNVVLDDNRLDANARGNLAANRMTLTGATSNVGSVLLGDIANDQSLSEEARIVATVNGGAGADIAGNLVTSTVTVDGNAFSADAAGNAATDNRVTVTGTVGGDGFLQHASALAGGSDGTVTLDNWQDDGTASVTAVPTGLAARIHVGGGVDGSTLEAADNTVTARATGDSASNTIDIAAGPFGATAALGNHQVGSGRVTTAIGSAINRGGSTIITDGGVGDSRFTVRGNSVAGSATGNLAANAMRAATSVLSGDGMAATSGPDSDEFGARGSLALVNDQTIGNAALADGTPAIVSTVSTNTGVVAPATLRGSSVTVADNAQRADGTANVASNALTGIAADRIGASLALSSTQVGQAAISASSDAMLSAPSALDMSSVSLTGNANLATATVNQVENTVTLTAGAGTVGNPAQASAQRNGAASASGDAVLGNQQFATGIATASAASRIGLEGSGEIDQSSVSISGNSVSADSAGNRALNALTAGSGVVAPSAAIASSQTNLAGVAATATLGGGVAGAGPITGSRLTSADNRASAIARGNAADNVLNAAGSSNSGSAFAVAGRGWTGATGQAIVSNAQSNYGSVDAHAGEMVALNAGSVAGSTLSVADNAMTAAAYGNVAANTVAVTGPAPSGGYGVANAQVNNAPVIATVAGSGYRIGAAALGNGAIGISGNLLAATATGNQASSAIATPR